MQFLLVLMLFLAMVVAILTLQNYEKIDFRLFFWTVEVSKILVILGSAFLGALAVFLAGLFQRQRRRLKEEAGKGRAKTGADAPEQQAPKPASETAKETPVRNG